MKWTLNQGQWMDFKGDCLVLLLTEKPVFPRELSQKAPLLEKAFERLVSQAQFEGKPGQISRLSTIGLVPFQTLLFIGLGEEKKVSSEALRKATSLAVQTAKVNGFQRIGICITPFSGLIPNDTFQSSMEGAVLASFAPKDYRKNKTPKPVLEETVVFCPADWKQAPRIFREVGVLGNWVHQVRDWVNLSSSIKTPRFLANEAKRLAQQHHIVCTVLNKKQLQKLRMNGILAVNAGSMEPPVLVKLEYKPRSYKKTLALVGKGVTFDSGGLNIKPWEGMLAMKQDMAGAATVMGSILAIAELQLPVRVLGFLPLTENMPGNKAMKCGDVVETFNGKTIEIIHTDAEGRIILADTLAFAETFKPDYLIDLATLTGAQVVALGRYFIGTMGNNPALTKRVLECGNRTMERCWELPLIDEWDELVKSDIADVQNISKAKGEAGTVMAGAFLKAFVEKTPWVHLDIASTAFTDGDSRPYLSKGGTGVGVRLLVELARTMR